MSIDILSLGSFEQNPNAINVALPVFAYECEATPPLDNRLDVYEEAILKLIDIGLPARSISTTLNATESLIELILDELENKRFVEKEIGKPWVITEDGKKVLNGTISERASDNSVFGYMFVNAIKKEVLPYFYADDIRKISLFNGPKLPEKLTIGGDENLTFVPFKVKRSKLGEAYRKSFSIAENLKKLDAGELTFDEAVDLFEDLDSFDEIDDEPETLENAEQEEEKTIARNMFIRPLNCPPQKAYLTMRIVIDPHCPEGYRVESPFEYEKVDKGYFLKQIQWLVAKGAYIGDEELSTFIDREVCKLTSQNKVSEMDFSVFLVSRIPLLKIYKDRFSNIYSDMKDIYALMQRQRSMIDKEQIVSNISRKIVECLFNAFFKGLKKETLNNIMGTALSDLDYYGKKYFVDMVTQKTTLSLDNNTWTHKFVSSAIGRISSTKGNSIVEKFINVIILNYYLGTTESKNFLTWPNAQKLYSLTDSLNRIRRKVSHDTDERFESRDYEFYMANVFELINGLLEAFKEN